MSDDGEEGSEMVLLEFVDEETGEVHDSIEIPEEVWQGYEILAEATGEEPEDLFADAIETQLEKVEQQ